MTTGRINQVAAYQFSLMSGQPFHLLVCFSPKQGRTLHQDCRCQFPPYHKWLTPLRYNYFYNLRPPVVLRLSTTNNPRTHPPPAGGGVFPSVTTGSPIQLEGAAIHLTIGRSAPNTIKMKGESHCRRSRTSSGFD